MGPNKLVLSCAKLSSISRMCMTKDLKGCVDEIKTGTIFLVVGMPPPFWKTFFHLVSVLQVPQLSFLVKPCTV